MAVLVKTLGTDRLNVNERLALVEEIWATICADATTFHLSDAQRAEFDRRVADDDPFPEYVMPWDEVKAPVRLLFGQLAQDLLDSVASEAFSPPVTDEQRAELRSRLAHHRAHPEEETVSLAEINPKRGLA